MLLKASGLVVVAVAAGLIAESGRRGFLTPGTDPAPPPRAIFVGAADGPAVRVPVFPDRRQSAAFAPGQPVLSLLNIRSPMKYGEFLWNEENVPEGETWVRVDLERQLISVFRAGHEIGTAVILYGAENKPTPAGQFPVIEKRREHRSTLYDAPMPFMLRLTGDGVAIHGSPVRRGSATHGCIGVPLSFARLLYEEVSVGEDVVILS